MDAEHSHGDLNRGHRGNTSGYRNGRRDGVGDDGANRGGIALDVADGKMSWTTSTSGIPNKIQRADLNGSNVEDVITGLTIPVGMQ